MLEVQGDGVLQLELMLPLLVGLNNSPPLRDPEPLLKPLLVRRLLTILLVFLLPQLGCHLLAPLRHAIGLLLRLSLQLWAGYLNDVLVHEAKAGGRGKGVKLAVSVLELGALDRHAQLLADRMHEHLQARVGAELDVELTAGRLAHNEGHGVAKLRNPCLLLERLLLLLGKILHPLWLRLRGGGLGLRPVTAVLCLLGPSFPLLLSLPRLKLFQLMRLVIPPPALHIFDHVDECAGGLQLGLDGIKYLFRQGLLLLRALAHDGQVLEKLRRVLQAESLLGLDHSCYGDADCPAYKCEALHHCNTETKYQTEKGGTIWALGPK
mmetsp:Transcript_113/g.317  ORF Transcript_113/g.317 Transcript_113/m.317 type:complete len:322 (-) Transcript_113:14-979(-)